jgi:hypothetical protein
MHFASKRSNRVSGASFGGSVAVPYTPPSRRCAVERRQRPSLEATQEQMYTPPRFKLLSAEGLGRSLLQKSLQASQAAPSEAAAGFGAMPVSGASSTVASLQVMVSALHAQRRGPAAHHVHVSGARVWCMCLVHVSGARVRCTCLVHVSGAPEAYTCCMHLTCTHCRRPTHAFA